MPHWLIKSVLQRTLSILPASHLWNAWFQKYVTHSLDLTPERFDTRLDFSRRHLQHFLELRPQQASGFRVLEIGTGWYPVVPVALYLCGAAQVWTFDIAPLLSRQRVQEVLARIDQYERDGKLQKLLPRRMPERIAELRKLTLNFGHEAPQEFLKRLSIEFRVAGAQNTGLPAHSIDLFVSTGVLEYIPRPVLAEILAECRRLGSAAATQSHYLNLVDQYSYFDRSITPFNFLKFSNRRWSYFNSPLTWQNRLRISDYRALFSEAGYQITHESNSSGSPADLQSIQLAPEFQNYSTADLLVLISWLVAKPVGT
jgi:hypothetical protein